MLRSLNLFHISIPSSAPLHGEHSGQKSLSVCLPSILPLSPSIHPFVFDNQSGGGKDL